MKRVVLVVFTCLYAITNLILSMIGLFISYCWKMEHEQVKRLFECFVTLNYGFIIQAAYFVLILYLGFFDIDFLQSFAEILTFRSIYAMFLHYHEILEEVSKRKLRKFAAFLTKYLVEDRDPETTTLITAMITTHIGLLFVKIACSDQQNKGASGAAIVGNTLAFAHLVFIQLLCCYSAARLLYNSMELQPILFTASTFTLFVSSFITRMVEIVRYNYEYSDKSPFEDDIIDNFYVYTIIFRFGLGLSAQFLLLLLQITLQKSLYKHCAGIRSNKLVEMCQSGE